MFRQQPCFLSDGIQLDKIFTEKKVEPFSILLLYFGEYPQQIAVVKIQCPEASHLFAGLQVSGHSVMFGFRCRFRQRSCSPALFQNPPANTLQRVAFVIFILSYSPFSYISGNFPTFHFRKVQIIPLYFMMPGNDSVPSSLRYWILYAAASSCFLWRSSKTFMIPSYSRSSL